MTTSGTTAFSLTARDIANKALIDELGVFPAGETLDADLLTTAISKLNGLLKSWQQDGLLWKQQTITVTTTAAVAGTALAAYVRGVSGVRYVESATNEQALERWERDDYKILPNKASAGTPSIFYFERGSPLTLYLWPVPASAATLAVDIDRACDTVTSANETVDIPEEIAEAVWTNLAVRSLSQFRISPAEVPELVERAAELKRQAFDNYRPASYMLGAC